jgi:outer membrane protein OmpA-like peptidoglycan-associated protein
VETTNEEITGSRLPDPEVKPLLSRLLPWVVLLLAALALLYFLDRGCAKSANKAEQVSGAPEAKTGERADTMKADNTPSPASSRPVSTVTLPGGSKITADEGTCMGRLAVAFAASNVNPNTAFILDHGDFEGRSAVLTTASQKELESLVTLMKAYPGVRIRIEAHTDNSENAEINKQLSTQQALAIGDFLQGRGVDRKRITTIGRGQTKPLVVNDSEDARRQNRRIEIYVITND